MNVLILSASNKSLLVKSFREAVKAYEGLCVAADISQESAALFAADRAVLLPRTDDPLYESALHTVCEYYNIRLVVPTRDGEMLRLSDLAPGLRRRGVDILVAAQDTLETLLNTHRFVEYCGEHGFQTPDTYFDHSMVKRYPVFCRAVDRAQSHPALRVNDPDELDAYMTLFGRVNGGIVIQDFIDAPEFSIDTLMTLDGRPLQAVARRRIFLRSGESWKSQIVSMPKLTETALQLAEKLGLVGHNLLQAFVTDKGDCLFIEANPRFGGASNLGVQSGLASPERIVQMVMGKGALARKSRPIQDGLMMLRQAEDIFLSKNRNKPPRDWRNLPSAGAA